jgi:hypothetical protein
MACIEYVTMDDDIATQKWFEIHYPAAYEAHKQELRERLQKGVKYYNVNLNHKEITFTTKKDGEIKTPYVMLGTFSTYHQNWHNWRWAWDNHPSKFPAISILRPDIPDYVERSMSSCSDGATIRMIATAIAYYMGATAHIYRHSEGFAIGMYSTKFKNYKE